MQMLETDRELPPLLTDKAGVAACITGGARALPVRASGVMQSLQQQVAHAMDAAIMHWYYVLDLHGGSHNDLKRTSFNYTEADFTEVFQILPPKRKVFNPVFRKACSHVCTQQYLKLEKCMDLLREVEKVEHFRYSFVVRLRADLLLHRPFPPVQSLKRAVYLKLRVHGASDILGIVHRDFAEAYFGLMQLPHVSSCTSPQEYYQTMWGLCSKDSCECWVKMGLVFHNATWVDTFFGFELVRNWKTR